MKRLTWRGVSFFPVASLTLALSAGLAQADDAADLFAGLDKNADGKLEKSEVPEEHQRHFERMLKSGDNDKDGILTREEFSSAANAEERPVTPPMGEGRPGGPGAGGRPNPEEIFRRLDKDGNGKISREEVRSSEMPEPLRGFLGRMFDELKKDELTAGDMRQARERMGQMGPGREGGPGGPGGGRMMIERLRQIDKNKDGKISRSELDDVPAEGRERLTQMMERMGRDEIDIGRMEEMMAQGGPGGRPIGDGPRPLMREGGRPASEGDRPRDGERPPEGGPRDGERRPEGGPRDGERRPEGAPRDGERRPEGAPRDGERRPEGGPRDGDGRAQFRPQLMRALDADNDGRISKEELQNAAAQFDRLDRNQDGHIDMAEAFGPPPGMGRGMGPQDNGRRPEGDRPRPEGERPRGEGDRPRPDGERPRGEGDRPRPEGERRPEADRPRGEGDRPRPEGDRPRPDGDRPRGEGDRPRPEGDRPRGEGDRPRPDGERRPEGDRPRGEGDRPRPEGERPPRGE